MPSLSQLQRDMASGDRALRAAAMRALNDFFLLFETEHEAWENAKDRVEKVLDDVLHNLRGVDTAESLKLKALVAACASRLKMLDHKIDAFRNSGAEITPPTSAQIADVKRLSGDVSRMQIQSDAGDSILTGLTQIARITNQVFSLEGDASDAA